jgi:hypothetical protein
MAKDGTENVKNQAPGRISFTQFPSRQATSLLYKVGHGLTGLAKLIRITSAASKDELPWLKLARFTGERSPGGSLRHDKGVLRLTGCEGDYDGEKLSIEEAAEKLGAAGIEALLYETASSKPGAPRWRVICPTSKPYPGDTANLRTLRWRWVARINGVLGGILAPESFVLSQAYYFGNVEGPPARTILRTEGDRVDKLDRLDVGAIYQNGRNTAPEAPVYEPPDIDFEETDDNPDLLDEAERIKADYLAKHGHGTQTLGHRARNLAQRLGDLGTRDGHILSSEAIRAVLGSDFQVPLAEIERWLSPEGRQSPRGCRIIDADPLDDPEFEEAFAAQEAREAEFTEPFEEEEEGEEGAQEQGPFTEAADANDASEPTGDAFAADDEEEIWLAEDDPGPVSDGPKEPPPGAEAAADPKPRTKPPFDHRAAVARAEAALNQGLNSVFQTVWAAKRLFIATMGLGKTQRLGQLLAKLSDPAQPDPISRPEREALAALEEFDLDKMLDEDSRLLDCLPPGLPPGQILYVAQRHDLLLAFATQLKEALRRRGWDEAAIERNVVILEARERHWLDQDGAEIRAPLCRRWEEVEFLKAAGDFSVGKSLCRRPATLTQAEILCPFYEECEWQRNQRKAATARFVLMTHAHLSKPFPAPHTVKWGDPIQPPRHFNPKNADLVIIDEDLTSTMVDEKARKFEPGDFTLALPADAATVHRPRHRPAWEEPVDLPGALIEQALNQANPRKWARAHGITPQKLWRADRYCRSRERSKQSLGHPGMSLDERKSLLKGRTKTRRPKISRALRCLAIELGTSWDGPFLSLRKDPSSGKILFRARPMLWNMAQQKVIVLDGTAQEREVRVDIPEIKEVRIEVPRNAVTILVYDEVCSKKTLLKPTAKVNGEPRYDPAALLRDTFEFAELCSRMLPQSADGKPRVAATMIKEARQALTGNWDKKLRVAEEFHGVLIGHAGNTRGSNEFKDCEIGVHIGRLQWPVEPLEEEGKARHFDSSEKITCVEHNQYNQIVLPRRRAKYRAEAGVTIPRKARGQEVSYHPDPQLNDLLTLRREREREQGRDRLRLIHNPEPKLEFLVSNIEPPDEVDLFITSTELNDTRLLLRFIEGMAGRASTETTGDNRAVPLRPEWLHEHFPALWTTRKRAELWVARLKGSQVRNIAEEVWKIADRETLACIPDANKENTISSRGSREGLKENPQGFRHFSALPHKWTFAEWRQNSQTAHEWSLFMYRGEAPSRRALGAELAVDAVSLEFRTLAGDPLTAEEDTGPTTGNALLDQALARCLIRHIALPLAPKSLSDLFADLWPDAKAAENWKAGTAVTEILARGPPEGWSAAEYRLTTRRGGKPVWAWIPPGIEPRAGQPSVCPLTEENCGEPKPSAARPASSSHVWIH